MPFIHTLICTQCDQFFEAVRSTAQTCSENCRSGKWRDRQRAAKEAAARTEALWAIDREHIADLSDLVALRGQTIDALRREIASLR
jgi:predicted nucleic acid-binding Zn ribbon protein